MIFVLATLFAQAHDLRRAGLARDVEPGHLDSGGSAGDVNDRPHGVDYQIVLVFRDRENLWLRAIESSLGTRGPIIRTSWIVADGPNRAHFLQEMRHIHLAPHADGRMRPQQSDWRQNVFALPKR